MSAWILVLFLTTGYKGEVGAIEMPDQQTCERALGRASGDNAGHLRTFTDGACIYRGA